MAYKNFFIDCQIHADNISKRHFTAVLPAQGNVASIADNILDRLALGQDAPKAQVIISVEVAGTLYELVSETSIVVNYFWD